MESEQKETLLILPIPVPSNFRLHLRLGFRLRFPIFRLGPTFNASDSECVANVKQP